MKLNSIGQFLLRLVLGVIFVFFFCCALLLTFYVGSSFLADYTSFQAPFSLYTIISGSMEPSIHTYDVVLTENTSSIQVGDVITFISSNSYTNGYTITHRVVSIQEMDGEIYYETKGDANSVNDPSLVPASNVLGKKIFVIPQAGRLQLSLIQSGNWIFLLLLPLFGLIIYDCIHLLELIHLKKRVDQAVVYDPKKIVIDHLKQEETKKEVQYQLSKYYKDSKKISMHDLPKLKD